MQPGDVAGVAVDVSPVHGSADRGRAHRSRRLAPQLATRGMVLQWSVRRFLRCVSRRAGLPWPFKADGCGVRLRASGVSASARLSSASRLSSAGKAP